MYLHIPHAVCETSIYRNFDIINIASDGQTISTNSYGPIADSAEECVLNNNANECMPNLHYVSESNGWSDGGAILGTLNDSLWIKFGDTEYLCKAPLDFISSNMVIQDADNGVGTQIGFVIASRDKMLKLSNYNCLVQWEVVYTDSPGYEVFSIEEVIPLSYGVVGQTYDSDVGSSSHNMVYANVDNNGEIQSYNIIGENNDYMDGGRIIKGAYDDYPSDMWGLYLAGLSALIQNQGEVHSKILKLVT